MGHTDSIFLAMLLATSVIAEKGNYRVVAISLHYIVRNSQIYTNIFFFLLLQTEIPKGYLNTLYSYFCCQGIRYRAYYIRIFCSVYLYITNDNISHAKSFSLKYFLPELKILPTIQCIPKNREIFSIMFHNTNICKLFLGSQLCYSSLPAVTHWLLPEPSRDWRRPERPDRGPLCNRPEGPRRIQVPKYCPSLDTDRKGPVNSLLPAKETVDDTGAQILPSVSIESCAP